MSHTSNSCVIYEQTGGNQNFALIRSKGDQALFGKYTKTMKAQWRVPINRPLADFAPTIILKAKDFATEITIHNAREKEMSTESEISFEHVKKLERRLVSSQNNALKNPDGLEDK